VIRIRKPKRAPAVLRGKGKTATAALCAAYDAAPEKYASGERLFNEFDRTIYAAAGVKQALLRAQHGKCAFCESHIPAVSYGAVEHLRPKAGFKQREDDPLGRPGYYWLAYARGNLYFSCQICNERFKGNLFPLANPRRRARCHRHRVSREKPLLIDPGKEDPAEFLAFEEEYVRAVDGSVKGETTIRVLGLDREALTHRRREYLRLLWRLLDVRQHLVECRESGEITSIEARQLREIDALLEHRQQDHAEYAAMTRAALRPRPGRSPDL
jgi:hypothetical protein